MQTKRCVYNTLGNQPQGFTWSWCHSCCVCPEANKAQWFVLQCASLKDLLAGWKHFEWHSYYRQRCMWGGCHQPVHCKQRQRSIYQRAIASSVAVRSAENSAVYVLEAMLPWRFDIQWTGVNPTNARRPVSDCCVNLSWPWSESTRMDVCNSIPNR